MADPLFGAADAAIRSHFDAGWRVAGVLRTPVHWPGQDGFVPPEAAWVRLAILWGPGNAVAIGNGRQRWTGQAVVQVFVPYGTGTQQAAELCSAAASIFDGASLAATGRVRFWTPGLVVVGHSDRWWQQNVSAPFWRDRP